MPFFSLRICFVSLLSSIVFASGLHAQFSSSRTVESNLKNVLRLAEVREEIELNSEEYDSIVKWLNDNQIGKIDLDQIRQRGNAQDTKELLENLKQKQLQDMSKFSSYLQEVLSIGQFERLTQISVQQLGVRALEDPNIIKNLEITDEQQSEMTERQQEYRQTIIDSLREARGDENRMREVMKAKKLELDQAILKILTEEQRVVFAELKGEKFDMPKSSPSLRGSGGVRGAGGFRMKRERKNPKDDEGGKKETKVDRSDKN